MSGTDGTKPVTKSGRRNRKGEQRHKKPDAPETATPVEMQAGEPDARVQLEPVQAQAPEPDLQPPVGEPLEAAVAEAMVEEADTVAADAPSPAKPAAAEPAPVSLQTVANAYRDYTRKSFEEFGSFFEQLSSVRSLDKAMEVQTEFVKRAYANSVAESQKIRELHRKLARQTFEPFQALAGKTSATHGKS